jgi:sulfur carrier protein
MGIEPTFTAWEAVVLPLDDTRGFAPKCIICPMIQVTVNGAARRFERPLAVNELVAELALCGKKIAVERNGEIVPKSAHGSTLVADGDRLEIVVAVGGG